METTTASGDWSGYRSVRRWCFWSGGVRSRTRDAARGTSADAQRKPHADSSLPDSCFGNRKPGERILPHNFQSGRDYRGGNALYLALNGLERGYADPRWGGYRQIQEAGGHVRKGEKGTPIMYVEWR